MKIKYFDSILIIFLGFNIFIASDVSKADQEQEDVNTAISQFYVALNEMFKGNIEPMKEVWSHADDVTYMGPTGGIKIGWQEVLSDWQSQADMKLGGTVNPQDMKIYVGSNLAITVNYEKGSNINAEGKPQEVSIRATNTFRKEDGKWKMIGHHTDLLPFLQEKQSE